MTADCQSTERHQNKAQNFTCFWSKELPKHLISFPTKRCFMEGCLGRQAWQQWRVQTGERLLQTRLPVTSFNKQTPDFGKGGRMDLRETTMPSSISLFCFLRPVGVMYQGCSPRPAGWNWQNPRGAAGQNWLQIPLIPLSIMPAIDDALKLKEERVGKSFNFSLFTYFDCLLHRNTF